MQEPAQAQQSCGKVLQLIEQLEIPELCYEERLDIACHFRNLFGLGYEHTTPEFAGEY